MLLDAPGWRPMVTYAKMSYVVLLKRGKLSDFNLEDILIDSLCLDQQWTLQPHIHVH